jgi:hypothetical protein
VSDILPPKAMHQWAVAAAYIEDLFDRAAEPDAAPDLVARVERMTANRRQLDDAMAGGRTLEQAIDWLRTQPQRQRELTCQVAVCTHSWGTASDD